DRLQKIRHRVRVLRELKSGGFPVPDDREEQGDEHQADRQPDPESHHAPSTPEAEHVPHGQAEHPVSDHVHCHRAARVADAPQHAVATACVPSNIWNAPAMARSRTPTSITRASFVNTCSSGTENRRSEAPMVAMMATPAASAVHPARTARRRSRAPT